jgi:hypothetical protein
MLQRTLSCQFQNSLIRRGQAFGIQDLFESLVTIVSHIIEAHTMTMTILSSTAARALLKGARFSGIITPSS